MTSRSLGPALSVVAALALACGGGGSDDEGDGSSEGTTMNLTDQTGPTSPTLGDDDDDGPATTDDATATLDDGSSSSGPAGSDDTSGSTAPADSSTGTPACTGMTFFATSAGSGELGGNLGGLEGADAMCQSFADTAGQGGCTWHAYLSTSTENARDRIGTGPWTNANGDMIASDVESLHDDGLSNGDPQHVLDETGAEVPGNEHDILTGSQEDGTLLDGATCADWTSDTSDEIAQVGHSDIPGNPQFSPSWNSAHDTPGCTAGDLESTGGAGRLYCFAID
jgi:hypothetical protein